MAGGNSSPWRVRPLAGAIMIAIAAGPVGAQVLEEVIVTAQKREESVQDVGIAITAFTGDQMEALGLTNSTDVAAMTPGVNISGNNGGSTLQFTIRGSTQNDFADIAEGPNAVYVDEAYMAPGQAQLFANFDTERVEILKGPQGTLFGRNATGGLVHYVTRKPTDTVEAFADVTYGRFDQVRTEAAVSGPLMENLKGRVAVMYNRHDPVIENVFTPASLPADPLGFRTLQGSAAGADDLWKDDQLAVRGQFLVNLNEDAELLVKGEYANQQVTSGQYQHESTTAVINPAGQVVNSVFTKKSGSNCEALSTLGGCVPGGLALDLDFGDNFRPSTTSDLFGYTEPDTRDLEANTDHVSDDYDEVDTFGFSAKLDWNVGFAKLISVTAYHELDKQQSLDVDSGPAPQLIVMNQSSTDWFTQELRLEGEQERYRWITGFYYLNSKTDYAQGLADSLGGLNVFSTLFGGALGGIFGPAAGRTPLQSLESDLNSELDTTSYSIFGQLDYDLTDQWILTLGLRAIREEKDYTFRIDLYDNVNDNTVDSGMFHPGQAIAPQIFFNPSLPGQAFSDESGAWLWSGKAQLNYKWSDDLLLYAGVNRGVKAGSYNAPLLTDLTPDQMRYDEEILLSYEGGFKSTFWDGKARLNGAIYYYDYSDYQAFQFIGTSGAVFNADAEYYGMELELQANPLENMDFAFGVGLIDATVKDIAVSGPVGGAAAVVRDVHPTFTPSVQLSGLARYNWPALAFGGDVAFQIDANYKSNAYHNINNFATHKMPAYVVGNARLTWYSPNEDWEVGAFVTNFADERYQIIGFELSTLCGCNEETLGRPRWWGANVRYNFD